MIIAVPEYQDYPASPAQWDKFFHTLDDKAYIQTLPTTDPSYPNWVEFETGAAIRESQRVTDTLIRKKYPGKDYQTYLDQTFAYIAEKWGDTFNDWLASEPGIMVASYVCAALDEASWYLDRESDEWYLEFTRIRANAAVLARYLGYKSGAAVSASVDVQFTLDEGPYSFDVPFFKGHQTQGPNSLIFEVDSDQSIGAGDTTKLLTVYQGKTYTESFISDGTAKQKFNLSLVPDDQFLAFGKSLCTVGGTEWTEYEFLPYSDSEAYEINYLYSPPVLRFGDGIIGKIPPAGEEIRISYIATSGKKGMLALADTIKTNLTSVVVNYQEIPVSVTNPEAASGGADPETLDSIKSAAPRYFMAAERLVTEGDYDTLAGSFRDSLYGAVAKANALILRSIDDDLELRDLMDAVIDNGTNLETYLNNIKALQDDILAATGDASTSGTIRNLLEAIKTGNTDIRSKTTDIETNVDTVKDDITNAKDEIATAQSRLNFLPFQELISQGDGTTTLFAKTLAQLPIQAGSVTVLVADKTPTKTAADGDCDATPGEVNSASIGFASGDVGKLIRIGGEYRQILKYKSATNVEYTGPRIYGTSLIVEVYPPAVIGYDDGAGNIAGPGIASGSVGYTTGALLVTFSVAPQGLSGQYGVPIMCTYQYNGDGIKAVLDDADAECDAASTNTDTFKTYGDDISTLADTSDTTSDDAETKCDEIDVDAVATQAEADLALVIPDQIANDVDALETYLATMFSSACKANIVRVSCLVEDANGFYTAPSNSLKQALKTYLEARKESTVTISVVSGAYYLLKTNMTINLKITDQYLFQDVSPLVSTAIDTMFKGRAYKGALKRSEYYGVIDGVDGVEYHNTTITGTEWFDSNNPETPPSVDANGNLFIGDKMVITKGTITIAEITS